MPYKDKDKQREAQAEWVRQKRDQGSTELEGSTGVPTSEGSTGSTQGSTLPQGVTRGVTGDFQGERERLMALIPADVRRHPVSGAPIVRTKEEIARLFINMTAEDKYSFDIRWVIIESDIRPTKGELLQVQEAKIRSMQQAWKLYVATQ